MKANVLKHQIYPFGGILLQSLYKIHLFLRYQLNKIYIEKVIFKAVKFIFKIRVSIWENFHRICACPKRFWLMNAERDVSLTGVRHLSQTIEFPFIISAYVSGKFFDAVLVVSDSFWDLIMYLLGVFPFTVLPYFFLSPLIEYGPEIIYRHYWIGKNVTIDCINQENINIR